MSLRIIQKILVISTTLLIIMFFYYNSTLSVEMKYDNKTKENISSIKKLILIQHVTRHEMKQEMKQEISMKNNTSVFAQNKTKIILYWDTFHNAVDMGIGLGQKIFENCSVSSCFVTNNKSHLKTEEFDAIIFHGARYSVEKNGIPLIRGKNQKYIFFSWESAFNTYFEPKVNNNFYNWTMTFKRNSDIFYPYGIFRKTKTDYKLPDEENLKNKNKIVAWFVSNCGTTGSKRRTKYTAELKKFFPVETYGLCGTLKCPHSDACYQMLKKNYKFYLSFENSMCEDYITEKLFNVMKYNVIPVVFGASDYDSIVPPKSVIDVRKFISPEHLAQYLLKLSENYTEYLTYFEWKKNYVVEDSRPYAMCQLCEKLHRPLEFSTYDDIKKWHFGFNCAE